MMMRIVSVLVAMCALSLMTQVHAEETLGEKAEKTAHNVKRSAKKGWNRTKEALCAKGDAKCLAEKAKHRAEEGADYMKDKAKEIKNDVDSDSVTK